MLVYSRKPASIARPLDDQSPKSNTTDDPAAMDASLLPDRPWWKVRKATPTRPAVRTRRASG